MEAGVNETIALAAGDLQLNLKLPVRRRRRRIIFARSPRLTQSSREPCKNNYMRYTLGPCRCPVENRHGLLSK